MTSFINIRLFKNERAVITLVIIIMVALSIYDMFEDFVQGKGLNQVVGDIFYMSILIGLGLYIWRHTPLTMKRRNRDLSIRLNQKHMDASKWRNRASSLLDGLGKVIDQQLIDWQLSRAEREVAILLLKGLSVKEIAIIRNSGGATVRQQATSIYHKAKINGRAELSAFFLEDLLLPNHEEYE